MAKHDFTKEDIGFRKISSRDQRKPDEIKVEGLSVIDTRFKEAMNDVQGLSKIYEKLSEEDKENEINNDVKNSLQELLRSQILLMESALDLYMHEVSKFGISKIFNNHPHWPKTTMFRNYKVSLGSLKEVYDGKKDSKSMANMIANMLQYSSYMKFDSIIQQLIMIGVINSDEQIPSDIEAFRPTITALNDRRNIIAHASDRDFKKDFRGRKQKIEYSEVQHFYTELKKFEGVIQTYIVNKD